MSSNPYSNGQASICCSAISSMAQEAVASATGAANSGNHNSCCERSRVPCSKEIYARKVRSARAGRLTLVAGNDYYREDCGSPEVLLGLLSYCARIPGPRRGGAKSPHKTREIVCTCFGLP
jgi:hypothetical protein